MVVPANPVIHPRNNIEVSVDHIPDAADRVPTTLHAIAARNRIRRTTQQSAARVFFVPRFNVGRPSHTPFFHADIINRPHDASRGTHQTSADIIFADRYRI